MRLPPVCSPATPRAVRRKYQKPPQAPRQQARAATKATGISDPVRKGSRTARIYTPNLIIFSQ